MIFYLLALSIFFSSALAKLLPPPIAGNWEISLNENFDGAELNRNVWNTKLETGELRYRRSKCFFLDTNVEVKDGNLVLHSRREKLKLKEPNGKFRKLHYSSGLVNSFRKFKQRYGYFEARIKMPSARGLWPAFWMMPDRSFSNQSPFMKGLRSTKVINDSTEFMNGQGMEIDIVEYLTQWKRKKIHWAAHWDGYSEELTSHHGHYKFDDKFSDDFHKYALYWDKGILIWYFDDKEIARLESDRVSDLPSYMIISTNIGGWATWRRERDKFPEETLIDYVRVWRKLKPQNQAYTKSVY